MELLLSLGTSIVARDGHCADGGTNIFALWSLVFFPSLQISLFQLSSLRSLFHPFVSSGSGIHRSIVHRLNSSIACRFKLSLSHSGASDLVVACTQATSIVLTAIQLAGSSSVDYSSTSSSFRLAINHFRIKMPCDRASHNHVWVTSGTLVIERCERFCMFCTGDNAAHRFGHAWFLRRHVRGVHGKEYPNLEVSEGW